VIITRMRHNQLMRKYGISGEQWLVRFDAQGRCCFTCKRTEPGHKNGWQTDHCHSTGEIRGILCYGCNVALGAAKDNPETLRALADYLQIHRGEITRRRQKGSLRNRGNSWTLRYRDRDGRICQKTFPISMFPTDESARLYAQRFLFSVGVSGQLNT
jgi:hypothetical protein